MFKKKHCRYSDINNNLVSDHGPNPFTTNIKDVALKNNTFRTALWTGEYLQTTMMCISVGECIGLECHPDTDQMIIIKQGNAFVQMGNDKNYLTFERRIGIDFVIFIPAGKWHNITNIGNTPLKLISVYAPPHHPWGTVHKTKKDAEK